MVCTIIRVLFLWYLQWKSKSISQHKQLFLLLSDASLYNHAICLQQTPVSSFLSMFANDTIPTVYVTCHINFLSNAILPALVYSTHSSVSSPNILIVYMIYQCSLYQISDAYSYFSLSSIAISSIRNLTSFHLPYPLFYALLQYIDLWIRAGQPSCFIFTVSDDEWWHRGFV